MIKVLLLISLLIGVAVSAAIPENDHVTMLHQPSAPYSFAWNVKDSPTSNDYSHRESSDGKTVRGSYQIRLSDGRIQTVTYRADSAGYVADVQYSDGQMNSNIPASVPAASS